MDYLKRMQASDAQGFFTPSFSGAKITEEIADPDAALPLASCGSLARRRRAFQLPELKCCCYRSRDNSQQAINGNGPSCLRTERHAARDSLTASRHQFRID